MPPVITVPEPISPLSSSVRGRSAPISSSMFVWGGQSRPTSASFTYLPSKVTRSPRNSDDSTVTYSRNSVIGEATFSPICAIQSWTPWPRPIRMRPGYARSMVAISIAVEATFRIGTGRMPMPTFRRSLLARAMAAEDIPPARKQSSHSHSSSRPAPSAALAADARCSGAICGRKTTPTLGVCEAVVTRQACHAASHGTRRCGVRSAPAHRRRGRSANSLRAGTFRRLRSPGC